MNIAELFRKEKITGRILKKHRLYSGNIGVTVQDNNGLLYSVEFKTEDTGPCFDNLYGLINEPFKGKGDYLDKLIEKGNYVEMNVSYSKGPFRSAYRLHLVSSMPQRHHSRDPYLPV